MISITFEQSVYNTLTIKGIDDPSALSEEDQEALLDFAEEAIGQGGGHFAETLPSGLKVSGEFTGESWTGWETDGTIRKARELSLDPNAQDPDTPVAIGDLHHFEKHYPNDKRPRSALDASRNPETLYSAAYANIAADARSAGDKASAEGNLEAAQEAYRAAEACRLRRSTPKEEYPCECEGKGWLLMNRGTAREGVQRCDDCKTYPNDEAAEAAAKSEGAESL